MSSSLEVMLKHKIPAGNLCNGKAELVALHLGVLTRLRFVDQGKKSSEKPVPEIIDE